MDVSIHTRDRSIATSADLLRLGTSAAVRLEFRGEPDRHCNPVEDKVTIFANDRADALRIAQGLREAADKLEAVYAPTMETATMQERRESVQQVYEETMAEEAALTRPTRCTRCNVTLEPSELDGVVGRDGNLRCEECEDAVQDELAAADAAEGHPCHREDA